MNDAIQAHNQKAAAMWSSGGRAYDEISRGIAGAIEHCVERLAPQPGEKVLDLATGTGWTSRHAALRGAAVTGVDIAEGLLDAARSLAAERGLDIDYRLGDAEQLPYPDDAFDAIVSTFGVMFVSNQEAASAELARVCRSGGRIATAAWLPGSNAVALRKVLVPFMPAPPNPPPPSPFNWGDPDWFRTTLGGAFELAFEKGTVVQRLPDEESVWRVYVEGFGPVKAVAQSLAPDRRQELRAAMIDWVRGFRQELGVAIPFDYLVMLGRKR